MVIMPFGKYKGLDICEVPDSYLLWLKSDASEKIRLVDEELARREAVANANMTLAEQTWALGYRQMAMKIHPDRGGSTQAMQDLNNVNAFILDLLKSVGDDEE